MFVGVGDTEAERHPQGSLEDYGSGLDGTSGTHEKDETREGSLQLPGLRTLPVIVSSNCQLDEVELPGRDSP